MADTPHLGVSPGSVRINGGLTVSRIQDISGLQLTTGEKKEGRKEEGINKNKNNHNKGIIKNNNKTRKKIYYLPRERY